MQKYFQYTIFLTVFITGAYTMIFELAGIRIVGPFLGTSVIVWSGTIGIIMASLAAGYHAGGKVADKYPADKIIFYILAGSGFAILYAALGSEKIILNVMKRVHSLQTQTLIITFLLFFPANFLFGMILPLSAKILLKDMDSSGISVGKIYALSTTGSIAGTILGGFVLIPALGHFNVLIIITFTLYLLSAAGVVLFHRTKLLIPLSALILLSAGLLIYKSKNKKYIDLDTLYNRVLVVDTKDKRGIPIRKLFVNNEGSSAMYIDNDSLVFEVLNYYDLIQHFKPDFQHVLMIGGSGYAYPKHFLKHFPGKKIDVVEIDPGLTEIAKRYFRLKQHPDMKIFHEDGRTFLNTNDKTYDAVFMDAYKSMLTIPFQLSTVEAVRKIYDNLNDDGIFFANIIASFDSTNNYFLRAELKTILNVFDDVKIFAVQYPAPQGQERSYFQNMMVVAFKKPYHGEPVSKDKRLNAMLSHETKHKFKLTLPVITDDYAPVEYYVFKALK